MGGWIRQNGISIVIAVCTLVSTYAVYGYRLTAIEDKVEQQELTISEIRSNNQNTQIALVKIQVDIEYIKIQLNKLVH